MTIPSKFIRRPLQLYLYVPYCHKLCEFCNWNVRTGNEASRRAYGKALIKEMEAAAPDFDTCTVESIYLAGGSPTELPQDVFLKLMRSLRSLYHIADDAEVTIETNPNRVDSSWMVAFQNAGVTRLSIGLVTGNSRELEHLGMQSSLQSAVTTLILPQMFHLKSYESRLLYGLPGQTPEAFRTSLRFAVRYNSPEITLRSYKSHMQTDIPLPSETQIGEMLQYTNEHLSEKGYTEYRPGYWAKPGHECRHLLAKETDGDYLSFGVGTYSRTDGVRYRTTENLGIYLNCSDQPEKLYTALERK